jgi:hypothetical protein
MFKLYYQGRGEDMMRVIMVEKNEKRGSPRFPRTATMIPRCCIMPMALYTVKKGPKKQGMLSVRKKRGPYR